MALDQQARLDGRLFDCRIDGDNQGDTAFAGNPICQKVDALDVEVGRVHLMADAHGDLMTLQVSEGPVDRFFHRTFDTTSDLEFASARRGADFETIQSDFGVIVYRNSVE